MGTTTQHDLLRLVNSLPGVVALGVMLGLGCVLVAWLLVRGFRREPPGVLRLTFLDARGVPNGVLLTVALAVAMMTVCTLWGLWSGVWVPGYVWGSWAGIAAWGIGADALVTSLTPPTVTAAAYGLSPMGPGPAEYVVPPSATSSPSPTDDAQPVS